MRLEDLDRLDGAILDILQADGRITNAELAERIHLSPSACLRRVRRLEAAGVVDRYAAILAPAALGYGTSVFVDITLTSQSDEALDAFERAVGSCPYVLECHLMAGDSDYLLRVATEGTDGFERIHRDYLARMPGVARIRSRFALRTVLANRGVQVKAARRG